MREKLMDDAEEMVLELVKAVVEGSVEPQTAVIGHIAHRLREVRIAHAKASQKATEAKEQLQRLGEKVIKLSGAGQAYESDLIEELRGWVASQTRAENPDATDMSNLPEVVFEIQEKQDPSPEFEQKRSV